MESKRSILKLIGRNNGLTTGELSASLGISATAVRRHLNTLEMQGQVSFHREQRGIGRPCHVYRLSNGASDVPFQSYLTFAQSILDEIKRIKTSSNGKLFELFNEHQKKRREYYISQTRGDTLSERVAAMARILEEEGRLVTWEQLDENRYILREHNCPLYRLVKRFDEPCRCELALLRTTLKTEVKRVNHIAQGDIACVYEIGRDPQAVLLDA